jgi:molecular chaperone DnaJ
LAAKRDYYEILGVDRNSSEAELKSAFRKLALKYHPDRNPGDSAAEEQFKQAQEAYSVLCDPQKRAAYDRFGHAGVGGASNGGAGGFDASVFADFSDIFGDIFGFDVMGGGGARRARSRVQRGSDLRYDLELTFDEALRGTDKNIRFQRLSACETCHGRGSRSGSTTACGTCAGRGQIRYQQGFFSVARTCSTCGGTGQVIKDPCSACRGTGRVQKQVEKKVTIPAGVDTGMQVRLSGEGEAGPNGGPSGDLFVAIVVQSHEFFERKGSDLYCTLPVSFPQAALGCEVRVPTPWGDEIVTVPAGIESGSELSPLKGKGVPRVNGRGSGDLHVVVHIEVPRKLTREQRRLLEELQAVMPNENKPRDLGIFERVKNLF